MALLVVSLIGLLFGLALWLDADGDLQDDSPYSEVSSERFADPEDWIDDVPWSMAPTAPLGM
jgi:hypothetical protein